MLIGMPVNEFNENKDLEVITFRRNILKTCKEIVDMRDNGGAHMRAMYAYTPEIDASSELPAHLLESLKKFTDGQSLAMVHEENRYHTHSPSGTVNTLGFVWQFLCAIYMFSFNHSSNQFKKKSVFREKNE